MQAILHLMQTKNVVYQLIIMVTVELSSSNQVLRIIIAQKHMRLAVQSRSRNACMHVQHAPRYNKSYFEHAYMRQ
jgi:hypothetical protein